LAFLCTWLSCMRLPKPTIVVVATRQIRAQSSRLGGYGFWFRTQCYRACCRRPRTIGFRFLGVTVWLCSPVPRDPEIMNIPMKYEIYSLCPSLCLPACLRLSFAAVGRRITRVCLQGYASASAPCPELWLCAAPTHSTRAKGLLNFTRSLPPRTG